VAGRSGVTDLSAAVVDYLALRRALGFKLARVDGLLNDFVGYLNAHQVAHVTIDAAVDWAVLPAGASSWWWCRRLGVARGFARYLQAIDPATQVPPAGLIHAVPPRAVPYLFTDADVAALLNATTGLTPPLRAETYRCLLGLLAVTGMRVSEAINLDDTDVDLTEGVLVVRYAKFDKTRELVLHPQHGRGAQLLPTQPTSAPAEPLDRGVPGVHCRDPVVLPQRPRGLPPAHRRGRVAAGTTRPSASPA